MGAISNRRRRGGVLLTEELIAAVDLLLPSDGTIFAVDGEKKELVRARLGRPAPASADLRGSFFRGGDKYSVPPQDRRGRAPARHFCAPQDVFCLCPGLGQIACR